MDGTKIKIGTKEYTPVAVDLGNSRIKFLLRNRYESFKYDDSWLMAATDFLAPFSNSQLLLAYSSVNQKRLAEFLKLKAINSNIKFIDIAPIMNLQTEIKFDKIKGIGIDRKLGMYGAGLYFAPPLITIDCGTAVTINVLNDDSECLGGVIFAGVDTQMRALTSQTANLNETELFCSHSPIGQNTEDALRSGIIYSVTGGIKEIVDRINRFEFEGHKPPIILTGGSSQLLMPALKDWDLKFWRKKHLILRAIISLLERNSDKIEL